MGLLYTLFLKNNIAKCSIVFLLLYGCIDSAYPPLFSPLPDKLPNENECITIAQIKSSYSQSSTISDKVYCVAYVVSNDLERNFYKEIFIQDSTGGIRLRADLTNISEKFGEGRQIVIKLQGLAFTIENNLPILGKQEGSRVVPLSSIAVDSFVIRTANHKHMKTTILKTDVKPLNNDIGKLVLLENVSFIEGGIPINETTLKNNQYFLLQMNPATYLVRISIYSNFVERMLPHSDKLCNIRGILSVQNNQWMIVPTKFEDITIIDP